MIDEKCENCNGCDLPLMAMPRSYGKTEKEYNEEIEKLKQNPKHILYKGIIIKDECKYHRPAEDTYPR